MKKLLILFTLLFSTVMFSSPSYAEWTKVSYSMNGNNFYVDFGRLRKGGGYVYFWQLSDYAEPRHGFMSLKLYIKGDCEAFRYKSLSYSFHKEPMGGGNGDIDNKPDNTWKYPPPKSITEKILKSVCSR